MNTACRVGTKGLLRLSTKWWREYNSSCKTLGLWLNFRTNLKKASSKQLLNKSERKSMSFHTAPYPLPRYLIRKRKMEGGRWDCKQSSIQNHHLLILMSERAKNKKNRPTSSLKMQKNKRTLMKWRLKFPHHLSNRSILLRSSKKSWQASKNTIRPRRWPLLFSRWWLLHRRNKLHRSKW